MIKEIIRCPQCGKILKLIHVDDVKDTDDLIHVCEIIKLEED